MASEGKSFKKGDRVKLFQIKKAEFEGALGCIAGKFNRKKKRWPVKLDSGKTVNVEPKNLRRVHQKKSRAQSVGRKNSTKSPPEIMAQMSSKHNSLRTRKKSTAKEKTQSPVLKKGVKVVLHGVSKKAYEGATGVITGALNEEKGRWPVKLDKNGKKVNIKPENLKIATKASSKRNGGGRSQSKRSQKTTRKNKKDKKNVEKTPADLKSLMKLLPVSKSEADAAKRKEMFSGMDQNGSGQISLAELDLGVRNYLGEDFFLMKPAMKAAFKAAMAVDSGGRKGGDDFVEKSEFRILLVNMRRYMELYTAFDSLSGEDGRIDFEEFLAGLEKMKTWGVHVTLPMEEFQNIDKNGGGIILFEEFAEWALNKGLDYDKDLDEGDATVAVMQPKRKKRKKKKRKKTEEAQKSKEGQRAEKKLDLAKYAAKLPVGRTQEEAQKRRELFLNMDQSANGQLSLAEIELGINSYVGEEVFLMKPAIKMAYKFARGVGGQYQQDLDKKKKKKKKRRKKDKIADAFVDFREFRILLVMIRQYLELYAAFDAIDDSDDNRISFEEFQSATEMLQEWGVVVDDPAAAFAEIDTNGGGIVLFEEFCEWALSKGLDYDKSLDGGDAKATLTKVTVDDTAGYQAYSMDDTSVSKQRGIANKDRKNLAQFANKLPVGRNHEESQERYKMFQSFDVSSNGQLSLAEIEAGIRSYVGEDVYLMKPALKMAYKVSRGVGTGVGKTEADSFVDFSEFRILLSAVRQYIELYAAFSAIDDGDDNRVNFEEFSSALEMMKQWDIEVSEEEARAEFDAMDENGGGQVLFGEFCEWALKKGLDFDKSLDGGDMDAELQQIEIDEENRVNKNEPDPLLSQAKRTYQKVELKELAQKLPTERNAEAKQVRHEMFMGMDKSGNGQLSLAEIDLGILEFVGEDFHIMKPAIKMAYKAAKGADGEGGMDDHFVEFDEFRILLINVRRYIELFAAFEAIDDGDDGFIQKDEFITAKDMISEWGVEVTDTDSAWDAIDADGGGKVRFSEFVEWALREGLDYDQELEDDNVVE